MNISEIDSISCKGRNGKYHYGLDTAASCSWFVWNGDTGEVLATACNMSEAFKEANHFYDCDRTAA